MFYFFRLALKNVFSRKSSVVIMIFITLALTLLILVNAVFDRTDKGIETVFKRSFTGNIVIREQTQENTSLFGNVSVIDESVIPTKELSNIKSILTYLSSLNEIECFVPQISTFSLLEVDNRKFKAAVFGVNIEEYLKMLDSIQIIDGSDFKNNEKGCLVSQDWCDSFYHENHYRIKTGDELQLIYSDGNTFRIRAVPIKGIFKYPFQNDILDKIVLVNANTVRSLLGRDVIYSDDSELSDIDKDMMNSFDEDFDFDSLFQENSDIEVDEFFGQNAYFEKSESESVKNINSDEAENEIANKIEDYSWDFLVIKLKDGVNENQVIRKINKFAKKNGYTFHAVNWRSAAGMSAQYIFYLRLILIIGIIVILIAGLIVVDNSLIINIVDRTKEIGTMRSLGASKRNISFLCMRETLILTTFSGIIACILSTVIIILLTKFPIKLSNPFFIQLFASEHIIPELSIKNYLIGLGVSVVVGLCSWIFPVIESLKILPVVAMKGGKN